MDFVKITLENEYETSDAFSNRILLRAYNTFGLTKLINRDSKPFFYGIVYDNQVYEYFTKRPINTKVVEVITKKDFCNELVNLTDEEQTLMFLIIMKVIFKENIMLDKNISTIEDLAKDRALQFKAYLENLSDINPYEDVEGYTKKHNIV